MVLKNKQVLEKLKTTSSIKIFKDLLVWCFYCLLFFLYISNCEHLCQVNKKKYIYTIKSHTIGVFIFKKPSKETRNLLCNKQADFEQ